MEKILKAIKNIKKLGLYPDMPIVNSPHKPEVVINGKKVFMFASNNYLGMMTDKRVISAAVKGVKKWGIGNGGSRLLSANLDIHNKLDDSIAEYKQRESAMTFSTGYMVNEGCIPAIANVLEVSIYLASKKKVSDLIIFSDEYNHASIIAGVRLSGAQKEIYKHNCMQDLEEKLSKYSKKTRKLIVSDGVFSMDGDIVNLPNLVDLAKKYSAMVYIDDAHATGILGRDGGGTESYFNMEGASDFIMGTFTKAFGGVGGFIASKKEVIDYLKITAKTSIFTAPIAPPIVCGLIKSVELVKKESWRREKLLQNALYMREKLKENGFDTGKSETQIIPIMIGNENKAIKLSKKLLEKRIYIPVVRWPAVPKNQARLRLSLMCSHSKNNMDYFLDSLVKTCKEL